MAEDPKPEPSFPVTEPTLESDDYVVYHGNDALAIYSNRDEGVSIDHTLNFMESTLFIYAETVYLKSKRIKIEGKNLGIFCNKLLLSQEEACIDVSGANGAASSSPADKAADGGNGGSVWLYVEEPTYNLRGKLRLKAYGGDGGHGASGKPKGGDGGDGGACGSLKCYIGSAALRYAQRLNDITRSQKWAGWVRDISRTISWDMRVLMASGLDEAGAKSWMVVIKSVETFLDAVSGLQGDLGRLVSSDSGHVIPEQETVVKAHHLLDALDRFIRNGIGPGVPAGQDLDSLISLSKNIKEFLSGALEEKRIQDAADEVLTAVNTLTPTKRGASQLFDELETFTMTLRNFVQREPQDFIYQTCHLGGGKGGPGGTGTTPDVPSGERGRDQPDKKAEGHLASLTGTKIDRRIDQAIASPEQCQMILDAADNLYFTNDRTQIPRALDMYAGLTKRLGFIEILLKDEDGKHSPLAGALKGLEAKHKLTIAPLSQLDGIYQAARRRVSSIMLSQDVWGHSDVWVPRLSLAYYGDRVKVMIEDFKDLEATFREYGTRQQKERMTETQVSHAQQVNGAMDQAAQDSMQSIIKHGGELEVAADKIAHSRPRMVEARAKLAVALEQYSEKIKDSFSISTDTFINALSTLCTAPRGFMDLVQRGETIHKSWAEIDDSRIKRDNIVKQIKTCEGKLDSLAKAYEGLDASELTVDDPGFAKIFASAADIGKILDEFEAQVPADDVREKMDAYLEIVKKRNEAVTNYNGLIQTYLQLQRVAQGCEDESRQLGERALSLNPSLPAIYFWLKRLKCQSRLQILRELNNQARALSFWGPMPVNSVTFPPPGPMVGHTQLHLYQEKLIDLFERSYEGFQAGGWNSWPVDKKFYGEGIRVHLGQDVIDKLIRGEQSAGSREVLLTITPKSHRDFLDMANVRLTQVRFWLLGATVDAAQSADVNWEPRRALRVEITHCGDDTIWDPDGSPCRFRHAPVTMQFSYETTVFNTSNGQCSGRPELVYRRQDIEHDYAGGSSRPGAGDKPPIGPFGEWKIQIREDVNPGLNLEGVREGWIEFCGRNQLATSPLREV